MSKDLRGKGAYRDSVLTRLCLLLPSSTPRRFSAEACSQMSADASLSRLLLVEADNSKHSKRTWRNHFEMSLELQPGGRPVDNDHARLPNFAQLCRVPATEVSILRRVGSSAVYEEQAFSWSGYPYRVKDVRVGISPDGARFLCLRLHALDGPVPTPRLGATEAQLSELELLSGKLLSYLHGRAYRVSVCLQGTTHPHQALVVGAVYLEATLRGLYACSPNSASDFTRKRDAGRNPGIAKMPVLPPPKKCASGEMALTAFISLYSLSQRHAPWTQTLTSSAGADDAIFAEASRRQGACSNVTGV